MNMRTIFVVLLAAICGISAAVGVNQFQQPVQANLSLETVPIVVTKRDIPRGRMVSAKLIKMREWPKAMLPQGAITKVEDAVDRAVIIPLTAGEPVIDAKLASKGAGRGLAPLIPIGMRAYTIQTTRVASKVAGFVMPGNRVDVLLTLRQRFDDPTGGGSSTTLLQSVEILAVAQRLDAPEDNKLDPKDLRSVTLLVIPEHAALLDLGQSLGLLSLSLRNPQDTAEADTRPATLADIRFRQEPVQEPVQKAEKPVQESPSEMSPKTAQSKAKPRRLEIRTLRGSQWGRVLLESSM